MALSHFHPIVADWFSESFAAPSECQGAAWETIKSGHDTLIAAPTGSGKTLAAFLSAIDELVREGEVFGLPDETRVLYISPLKALSNDIQKNLDGPLEAIHARLFEHGAMQFAIRTQVRTGDTPAHVRTSMAKMPPHILVTTPESVYILLTSDSGRRMLATVRTVIVDEIHALVGSKRGSHLALSLERLQRLTGQPLNRIGLSATQNPIETVADFLTGGSDCRIIDTGHRRRLDLAIELPQLPLEAVLSGEAARDIYDRMAALIEAHRTTLIFVNTRRLAERLARGLSERLGEEHVTSHHGSLSKEQRLSAENRLKGGQLKALVATASLELGIDVGEVDLVCQLGSTGSIAGFLQRVGRSGHFAGGLPKGRLFPTSRDDLIECIALIDAVRRGDLDQLELPEQPLDVLAQQIVAMLACEDFSEDELYRAVTRAWPYRNLTREDFDAVVRMLAEGYATRRGQRGAYLHRDGIHRRLRARKGARLTAVTCGGAIPDNAEYKVILEPQGEFIGTVDEDFAIESMAGDIFQLGNASWKVMRLEGGTLRVEDAHHQPPSIPFWFGEAPGRTWELSAAVAQVRRKLECRLADVTQSPPDSTSALAWLVDEVGIGPAAAEQAVNYLAAARLTLGALPTLDTVIFERFFDEAGGMQFIIHAPFGSRVNRGWGLALRKRFCRSFNFELQAAATENALILSLGTSQSFDLVDVARYLNVNTVRDILVQALLDAPMFTVRWRWNAVCSLALRRFQGGRKTPPYLLRMQAEDLVTAVFPDQLACLENIVGDREIPDHPLVKQTIDDCLTEAMDIDRLTCIIGDIERGAVRVICRDLVEPSPLAAEIVNSRAYTFLDGAPLEERRTRAVASRRWLDPTEAGDLARLDPAAIQRVREEAWPEGGSADELHDALMTAGFLLSDEAQPDWAGFFQILSLQDRAAEIRWPEGSSLWLAAERLLQFAAIYPSLAEATSLSSRSLDGLVLSEAEAVEANSGGLDVGQPACHPRLTNPTIWQQLPAEFADQAWTPEEALVEILRGRLSCTGPTTANGLADLLHLPASRIEQALLALQIEGFVLRGHFSAGGEEEWCERRLLARIHRYTLNRLRQEIEPVATGDFMRFLFRWQHVHPEARLQGPQALAALLTQLEGFEAPAGAWEGDILPARLQDYDPAWLDSLCLAGKTVWTRLTATGAGLSPVKSSPLSLIGRRHLGLWRPWSEAGSAETLSLTAQRVADLLAQRGALFFEELADAAGLLKSQLEAALGELVARGFVASDSYAGLRALLIPAQKKQRYRNLALGMEEAGRWTLVRPLLESLTPPADETARREAVEHIAGILLKRYGVVFRALLTREHAAPPWLDLLRVFRRLEARGEIRGGRFVAGHFGEQFALPDAVETLRQVRKQSVDPTLILLSAADPLSLSGIVTPGARVPALTGNRLLYSGGVPVAVLAGKQVSYLTEPDENAWDYRNRLMRRSVPPALKAYLG
jgi:ATP-dependent Lhr-like helicase